MLRLLLLLPRLLRRLLLFAVPLRPVHAFSGCRHASPSQWNGEGRVPAISSKGCQARQTATTTDAER